MAASAGLKRLVEQARSDPAFFHELVFDPAKAIAKAKYLDEATKVTLRRLNADLLLRNLMPDIVAECGETCGNGSCSTTCGAGSCQDTCSSSCGTTCGSRSCDHTSGHGLVFEETDPLRGGVILTPGARTQPGVRAQAGARKQVVKRRAGAKSQK